LATGFCDTGLTQKAPQPAGCLDSKLVNPINPQSGGPIVDGNWELAYPFPSAPYTQPAPGPCGFTSSYTPAAVDTPQYGWYNPDDKLSQWIQPPGGTPAPGWFIYRTRFAVPSAYPGYANYELVMKGQLICDDYVAAIYLENGQDGTCNAVASFTSKSQLGSWNSFRFNSPLAPDSHGFIYVVAYNATNYPPANNPSGIRVEFLTPYLYPY
jgi:hypothetical protein